MTLGGMVGIPCARRGLGAAAVRRRDTFWAAMALILVVRPLTIARSGLEATFIRDADDVAVMIGGFLMAGMVSFGLGLPKSLEDRLLLGDRLREWTFDQAVFRARQPFVAAAQAGDESAAGMAHWRHTVRSRLRAAPGPPWPTGSRRRCRVGRPPAIRGRPRTGCPGRQRTARLSADWDALRGPLTDRRRKRAAIVRGVSRVGVVAAAVSS